MSIKKEYICPITRLGKEKNHFFGYYNKTCFDQKNNRILALEIDFMDKPLSYDLIAGVGYFSDNKYHKIDETSCWNFQMGAQLQWLNEDEIIYNTKDNNTYQACILNIKTKQKRFFTKPLYTLSPDKSYFVTVNYDRLFITHETIGYCRKEGKLTNLDLYPNNDGIFKVDIKTGESTLIISYADLFNFHYVKSMDKAIHWVSHIEINTTSDRILFLHRWSERVEDEFCFIHRLITMDKNGKNLHLLEDGEHEILQLKEDFDPSAQGIYDYEKSDWQISHPMWKNDKEIIVWGPHKGNTKYHLYQDKEYGDVKMIAPDLLTENGHMSYSPTNQRFLLTDTYPNDNNIRELLVFDEKEDTLYTIGKFYVPELKKENRCDLHPRWSNDGNSVCIDSIHENAREMYIIDVSSIVNK